MTRRKTRRERRRIFPTLKGEARIETKVLDAWDAQAQQIRQAGGTACAYTMYDYRTGLYFTGVTSRGNFDPENPERLVNVLPALRANAATAVVEQDAAGLAQSLRPSPTTFFALRDFALFEATLRSLRESNRRIDINSAYAQMCHALASPVDADRTRSVAILAGEQIELSDPLDKQGASTALDMMWDDDKTTGQPPCRAPHGLPALVGVLLSRVEQGADSLGVNPIFVRRVSEEHEAFWIPPMLFLATCHPNVSQKTHKEMTYHVVELIAVMRECFLQGATEELK